MTVAQLIRAARVEAGLSQAELAERLGTTQPAVARLEREGANPRLNTLHKVMDATEMRLTIEVRPGGAPRNRGAKREGSAQRLADLEHMVAELDALRKP
ncbi:MAG: helix-turn-helix transcriptional regulator [Thermoleophilaceae bacterium]|nr:helix-turn-helix transcriptional regulator [Thermoleophilaceae bacterium]